MILNQNSIQSKIYRWFYNLEIMPESLCVYFWKLTLMWITIVPVSIISLPILLFTKKFNLMDRFLGGILFYFCLFTLYLLTLPIFQMLGFVFKPKTILYDMLHVGIYLWPMVIGSSLTVGILLLLFRKRKKYDYDYKTKARFYINDNHEKIYSPSNMTVFIEMVKSKFDKYCTKITWN